MQSVCSTTSASQQLQSGRVGKLAVVYNRNGFSVSKHLDFALLKAIASTSGRPPTRRPTRPHNHTHYGLSRRTSALSRAPQFFAVMVTTISSSLLTSQWAPFPAPLTGGGRPVFASTPASHLGWPSQP